MNQEGLLISERIQEVMSMCPRENPIYEQVSNFSIALYILGHFKCADLMSADDVETTEAAAILKEYFTPIKPEEIPAKYDICNSDDRYVIVFGDPAMPEHFAVLVNSASKKPYFSKLRFFGSGFDSLAELQEEFLGKDGIGIGDITYYRQRMFPPLKPSALRKIYTFRDDGSYSVFEDESSYFAKEVDLCP